MTAEECAALVAAEKAKRGMRQGHTPHLGPVKGNTGTRELKCPRCGNRNITNSLNRKRNCVGKVRKTTMVYCGECNHRWQIHAHRAPWVGGTRQVEVRG